MKRRWIENKISIERIITINNMLAENLK